MPEVHRPQALAGSASFLIGGSFVCCEQCSAWWGSRTWRVSFQVPCPRVPLKRQLLCHPPPTLLPQEPGWPEVVKVVGHLCCVYVDSFPNYSFWYKCWTGLKIHC